MKTDVQDLVDKVWVRVLELTESLEELEKKLHE